jgi:hypothetical protein
VTLSIINSGVVMLSVIYAKCRKQTNYTEYYYAECRNAECRNAECRYAPLPLPS